MFSRIQIVIDKFKEFKKNIIKGEKIFYLISEKKIFFNIIHIY